MHEAERQQLLLALTAATAEAAAASPRTASAQALLGGRHVRAVVEMAGEVAREVAEEMSAVTSGEKWNVWVQAEGDPAGREPPRLSTVTLPLSTPEAEGRAAGGAAAGGAAAGGAAACGAGAGRLARCTDGSSTSGVPPPPLRGAVTSAVLACGALGLGVKGQG